MNLNIFNLKQKQILFTIAFKFKHSYMRPEKWFQNHYFSTDVCRKCFYIFCYVS